MPFVFLFVVVVVVVLAVLFIQNRRVLVCSREQFSPCQMIGFLLYYRIYRCTLLLLVSNSPRKDCFGISIHVNPSLSSDVNQQCMSNDLLVVSPKKKRFFKSSVAPEIIVILHRQTFIYPWI